MDAQHAADPNRQTNLGQIKYAVGPGLPKLTGLQWDPHKRQLYVPGSQYSMEASFDNGISSESERSSVARRLDRAAVSEGLRIPYSDTSSSIPPSSSEYSSSVITRGSVARRRAIETSGSSGSSLRTPEWARGGLNVDDLYASPVRGPRPSTGIIDSSGSNRSQASNDDLRNIRHSLSSVSNEVNQLTNEIEALQQRGTPIVERGAGTGYGLRQQRRVRYNDALNRTLNYDQTDVPAPKKAKRKTVLKMLQLPLN